MKINILVIDIKHLEKHAELKLHIFSLKILITNKLKD